MLGAARNLADKHLTITSRVLELCVLPGAEANSQLPCVSASQRGISYGHPLQYALCVPQACEYFAPYALHPVLGVQRPTGHPRAAMNVTLITM